jgi:RNA polymerase sigma factor (sigma-70 family)
MSDRTETARDALTATFRDEWPRLVAAAVRILGDLQAAEDVVQETFVTALDRWPLVGVPERPGAWLTTACRNRALNRLRDTQREQRRSRGLRPLLEPASRTAGPEGLDEPPGISDDRLRLIAMCCHPLLSTDAQVALTLRMVVGLTTEQISRGFHLPAATIAQRIVRAKRTLAAHRVTFSADEPAVQGRLPAMLDVVYLIFNEGYLSTAGDRLTRGDLALEAHRLAGLLTELAGGEPGPWALRALFSLQLSRWATRTGPDGALLTMDAQDRSRWDRELIADGIAALERARATGGRGPLLLQAELAAAHATAATFADTDWAAIVALYDELRAVQDTAFVALNRAVAVAMADGPAAALPLLDELVCDQALRGSHRVWSVRADLHRRLGDTAAALADYDQALGLVSNDVERRYLADTSRRLRSDARKG